jgi:protein O-mannosyl-transferase
MTRELSHPWAWRAGLCALALAAYANSFGLGLAYDGVHMATGDPRTQAATWDNVRLIFGTPYWYPIADDRLYRPLTTLSFLFNHAVLGNGEHAAGYHWVNFLLHALNVLLVFELGRRLLGGMPGFWAAALWAVHPVGTEAVANLAGRADLLAAAGVLGALAVYAGMRGGAVRTLAVSFLCLAACLSKESAMVLPALMLLWDWSTGRKPRWQGKVGQAPSPANHRPTTSWQAMAPAPLRDYAAVLAALAVVLAARWGVFAASAWPAGQLVDNPLRGMGFWTARLTALKLLGMDLALLVWPAKLAFDHSYNQVPAATWRDLGVWVSGLVAVEILALVALRRKRDPVLFFAVGFYALTLLPASNLAVLIGSVTAVRFSYLPAVGFAIAAAALAFRLPNRRMAYVLLGTAVAMLGARTLARNPAWDSNLALGAADVEAVPGSFRAHRLYSNALVTANADANLEQAIREGEAAWEIVSPLPPIWGDANTTADLGYLYELQGDRAGGGETVTGRAWYVKSLDLLEQGAGIAVASRRQFDDDQVAHGKPLRFQGGYELLYLNLGKAYQTLGRHEKALAAFRKARAENPYERKAYTAIAGVEHARGDDAAAAVTAVERALLLGIDAEAAAQLRSLYRRLPGGECALAEEAGQVKLNLGCPRMGHDVCAGWADLAALFDSVRKPEAADKLRAGAREKGCR